MQVFSRPGHWSQVTVPSCHFSIHEFYFKSATFVPQPLPLLFCFTCLFSNWAKYTKVFVCSNSLMNIFYSLTQASFAVCLLSCLIDINESCCRWRRKWSPSPTPVQLLWTHRLPLQAHSALFLLSPTSNSEDLIFTAVYFHFLFALKHCHIKKQSVSACV